MKDKVLYVIIVILVIVIIGGATYLVLDNRNNRCSENANNTNDNSANNKENSNETNVDNKVLLSDSKLDQYLNYVPDLIDTRRKSIYAFNKISQEDLDLNDLIPNAAGKAFDCIRADEDCPFNHSEEKTFNVVGLDFSTTEYVPATYVRQSLKKMYNLTFNNSFDGYEFNYLQMSYAYTDGMFVSTSGGVEFHYNIIVRDSYQATDEELIMYVYASSFDLDDDLKYILKDYHNDYEIGLITDFEDMEEVLRENKDKFTKYKHTFKKNDTGYYWYSTEVASK